MEADVHGKGLKRAICFVRIEVSFDWTRENLRHYRSRLDSKINPIRRLCCTQTLPVALHLALSSAYNG